MPIDNFVSNFIFMEVEPQLDTMRMKLEDQHDEPHYPMNVDKSDLIDIDDDCDIDEDEDDDDEDDEEDYDDDVVDLLEPDDDNRTDVVHDELSHLHQANMPTLSASVKDEICGHEPITKKSTDLTSMCKHIHNMHCSLNCSQTRQPDADFHRCM